MKKAFRAVISIILVITMLTTPMFMHHSFAVTDETVYSIDVIWEDISFIYNQGDFEWNPGSHSYDVEDSTSGWDDKNGKITAINHSSLAVEILVSFELAEPANGTVALSIENELFILNGASGESADLSQNYAILTATGSPEREGTIGKIVVSVGAIEVPYDREDNIIYFGEYPQTLKDSSVTVSDSVDSRGYFLGSDNAYYAKLTATPCESGYKFSTAATVTSGTVYYFKVEPLKWRVLSENNGDALLLCESIIDSGRYDDASNNYEASEIRAWLNAEFYNTAFNSTEKNFIQTINVDNSLSSTGYSANSFVCSNTSDKVYLLSYADVVNTLYGFTDDASRIKTPSDYALASSVWVSMSNITANKGNGLWMLRTPNDTYEHFIRECNYNGEVTDGGTNLSSVFYGVVPAITIKL